ncbi:MAG: DUF2061 domain-containing protein [Candidatus Bathyarchaeota archaeon]|nr:MAG: DUF2061 domain-containing protein [Candidatus Bathyarchaeota archaeon]
MEKNVRSLVKSITWRVVATLTTILLVFLFTGNIVVSTSVGALEFLVKTVIYYLHERVWNLSNFGREKSHP